MSFTGIELKGYARIVNGWEDLNESEHRIFILRCLTEFYECVEELEEIKTTVKNQERYIEQLEKQVCLLQKTLDVVNRNVDLKSKIIYKNDFVTGEWQQDCEEEK